MSKSKLEELKQKAKELGISEFRLNNSRCYISEDDYAITFDIAKIFVRESDLLHLMKDKKDPKWYLQYGYGYDNRELCVVCESKEELSISHLETEIKSKLFQNEVGEKLQLEQLKALAEKFGFALEKK
jgi:hypothetical protein